MTKTEHKVSYLNSRGLTAFYDIKVLSYFEFCVIDVDFVG